MSTGQESDHDNERDLKPTGELVELLRSRLIQAADVERTNQQKTDDKRYKQPAGTFLSRDAVTIEGTSCYKARLLRPTPEEAFDLELDYSDKRDMKISILVPIDLENGIQPHDTLDTATQFFFRISPLEKTPDADEPIVYLVNAEGLWPLCDHHNIDLDEELAYITDSENNGGIAVDEIEMQLAAIHWLNLFNEYNIAPFDTNYIDPSHKKAC